MSFDLGKLFDQGFAVLVKLLTGAHTLSLLRCGGPSSLFVVKGTCCRSIR
jgi:hypothetical protein